ncbi:MAG TPA: hypothetical protein VFJ01_06155 [Oleiagrimonas sp.]|nr:hypothetical protein [Oleiagrimonas sp.]
MDQSQDKVLTDLGEVKGLLRGVTDMIRLSQETTNKRIDDLSRSIHQRMDSTDEHLRGVDDKADKAMNLATDTAARVGKHSLVFGGGAGVVAGTAVAIIKALWH